MQPPGVGGYAMAAHRLPRGTKDLDLWIRANKRIIGRPQDRVDAGLLESHDE
jgi:hypothetical protein